MQGPTRWVSPRRSYSVQPAALVCRDARPLRSSSRAHTPPSSPSVLPTASLAVPSRTRLARFARPGYDPHVSVPAGHEVRPPPRRERIPLVNVTVRQLAELVDGQ